MNCPKCNLTLTTKYYKGAIEVEACPACRGMWLDARELDKLEDLTFDEDPLKGSLIHFGARTERPCPQCGANLTEFQYRLYDLRLDYCAESNHGFWLDGGEDERVTEIMRQRAADMRRKLEAESTWRRTLKAMHSFLKTGK